VFDTNKTGTLVHKSPLATSVLSEHRQLDAHGVLGLDGVAHKDHNGSNTAMEAASLEQEANLHLAAEACSCNVPTVARAATHVVHVNARNKIAAVARVVLRDEVTTTQDALERSFARRLCHRVSIVEEHVGSVSQAAASTMRKRIVSVNEALADD